MINIIIIILIILLIISYKTKNRENIENVNIDNDINNIIKQIYKTDLNKITDMSNKLDNIKSTSNVNLTNNFTNTGLLKLINSTYNSNKVKITGNVNFTNRNNRNTSLDIFPRYFIMVWPKKDIPTGWVICDGKSYTIQDGNNSITITVPDFRNMLLRGTMNENDLNKKSGSEKQIIGSGNIPIHNHTLSTKYDSSKPYMIDVGFDYERLLTINPSIALLSDVDRSYSCGNIMNPKTCETDIIDFNLITLNKIKARNPTAGIYYGTASEIMNRFVYTYEDMPLSLSADLGKIYVKTTELSTMKPPVGLSNTALINAFDQLLQKEISVMPAYCALNYIMKLS